MEAMEISIKDLLALATFIVLVGGVFNAIIFAVLRSRFVPRSFLFCPTGTPIYRTIKECKEMEIKLEKDRRERDGRIEKAMQEKVDAIEASHAKFTQDLMQLFKTQTTQIAEAVRTAVGT